MARREANDPPEDASNMRRSGQLATMKKLSVGDVYFSAAW